MCRCEDLAPGSVDDETHTNDVLGFRVSTFRVWGFNV